MDVDVELPAALAELAGSSRLRLTVDDGATLLQVFEAIDAACPAVGRRLRDENGVLRRFVNVYVDGADVRALAGLASPVPHGASVLVLPSIAGG